MLSFRTASWTLDVIQCVHVCNLTPLSCIVNDMGLCHCLISSLGLMMMLMSSLGLMMMMMSILWAYSTLPTLRGLIDYALRHETEPTVIHRATTVLRLR